MKAVLLVAMALFLGWLAGSAGRKEVAFIGEGAEQSEAWACVAEHGRIECIDIRDFLHAMGGDTKDTSL